MTDADIEQAFELAAQALKNPSPDIAVPSSIEGCAQMASFLVAACRALVEGVCMIDPTETSDGVLDRTVNAMNAYMQVELAAKRIDPDPT